MTRPGGRSSDEHDIPRFESLETDSGREADLAAAKRRWGAALEKLADAPDSLSDSDVQFLMYATRLHAMKPVSLPPPFGLIYSRGETALRKAISEKPISSELQTRLDEHPLVQQLLAKLRAGERARELAEFETERTAPEWRNTLLPGPEEDDRNRGSPLGPYLGPDGRYHRP